jgi:hypothetical protein
LLQRYEGHYRAGGRSIAIACMGSRLLLDVLGDGVSEFYACGEGEYFSRTSRSEISFQAGGAGEITGLILREGGKDSPYTRI